MTSRLRAPAIASIAAAVSVAGITGPGSVAAFAPATAAEPSAAQLSVTVSSGEIRWNIEATDEPGRHWLRDNGPCLTLTAATTGTAGRNCVVAPRRAVVTRPDGSTFRAPVRTRWHGQALSVVMRQADIGQPAGEYASRVDCSSGACRSEVSTLTLPVQRLVACRAAAPWLVHEGAPGLGKAVALTFDDGPGANTRRILRILHRHDAPATFFQLGRMATRDPESVARVVRAGHVVGNHSDSHPVLDGQDRRELLRANRALRRAGAPQPCVFRAPYGENPPDVVRLARSLGMTTVHWNTDPGDWRGLSADQMVATTLDQVRPGAILVFHDGEPGQAMPTALPRILAGLKERGYRFLTVPELLRLDVTYR